MSPRRLSLRDRFDIRDGLDGGALACGCVFGRYLTYAGTVLTVVDDATRCREGHRAAMVLDEGAPDRGGEQRTGPN